ncbi:flavin reductase [Bradyrhizobium zhanjiangense]|uniref:flavin reductase n=1 Tax=Bradyrhizobium zhanjiangense TaxID=1325107 RepID=UPI001008C90C
MGQPKAKSFLNAQWEKDEDGLPVLEDAQANLIATVEQKISYGTHTVFIAKIDRIRNLGSG